jgi:protein-S-isoprenylcysteine O-methyltransferase Ste14
MKPSFSQRGGGWVLAQGVLIAAVLTAGPGWAASSAPGALRSVSGLLLAVGAGFGLAGVVATGRQLTPFPKPPAGSVLIQHGIYRYARHPLYTSVMALAWGWGLIWASGVALIVAGLLTALLYFKARREERWLRAQFPGYADYARRVRRFVPGVF